MDGRVERRRARYMVRGEGGRGKEEEERRERMGGRGQQREDKRERVGERGNRGGDEGDDGL